MNATLVEKLELLAGGVDPFTERPLPNSSVFHHPDVARMILQLALSDNHPEYNSLPMQKD